MAGPDIFNTDQGVLTRLWITGYPAEVFTSTPVEATNTGMVESPMLDNQTVVTPMMVEPSVCILSDEKINLKKA